MNNQENINQSEVVSCKKWLNERNNRFTTLMTPYATFLVKYPSVVVILLLIVIVLTNLLSVWKVLGAKDLPNFGEPTKGFEPRGTKISSKDISLKNLLNQNGILTGNASHRTVRSTDKILFYPVEHNIDGCALVFEQKDQKDLFSYMQGVCKLHKEILLDFPGYNNYFRTEVKSHHIPNYIAYFYNKPDCFSINETDVYNFKKLLVECIPFYKNNTITDCKENDLICANYYFSKCFQHELMSAQEVASTLHNVYFYLVEKTWVDDPTKPLRVTLSVDPNSQWNSNIQKNFFKPLYDKYLTDLSKARKYGIQISSFDFYNFKYYIFENAIVTQSLLIITAVLFVVLFLWYFSNSLFISLMTLACVIISITISYFVYGRVFDMDFFPFLNMATLIFLVGVGADDAFVYMGVWKDAKQSYVLKSYELHQEYLIIWTIHALKHAILPMFVTSFTTAAAFYANISSNITSVKCFGLYAGTAIIVNYLLMITFFPVVVILHEKYFKKCMARCLPCCCTNDLVLSTSQKQNGYVLKFQMLFSSLTNFMFNLFIPTILRKLKYFWLILFILIGIGGLLVTFFKPGLQLPSSQEFQMFGSGTSIEQYSLNDKKKFEFSKGTYQMEATFVFGVEAVDNGYKFNPDDHGSLVLKPGTLDLASEQIWLQHFCQNARKASFFISSPSCDLVLNLFSLLEGPCRPDQTQCCNKTLPYDKNEFNTCFYSTLEMFPITNAILFDTLGRLRVLIIKIQTNFLYSLQYSSSDAAYNDLDKWFSTQIKNATTNIFRESWWRLPLQFYDLQKSLFEGTKQSLGISVGVAFIVILFTTWNILLSIYSIITIAFILSVTIGVLVLCGWHLNIMESIIFSVAAGLSADFTLHYSIAYLASSIKDNKVERTLNSLKNIGPAVLMGAITTFIAGLVMVMSSVLVYVQMAHFLMLIMFTSWAYSTFFLLPLLMIMGPLGNTGQLVICKVKKSTQVFVNHKLEPLNELTAMNSKQINELTEKT
ncbi:protein dispatched homolog 1 isoform X1 [Hydra vulgaris]|uniref:protein dispatched homolog 1 isoform X1 n=1 Tax=Hydra vulgaris TaxID=6087 RepID=UPI001F5E4EB4|nr:protein dispatched homolog 1 isoform X1 [Hydra vulgaris]